MPDCTHGDVRPCAGCRILAAGYDAARPGAVPAWRTRVLMEAHAAAARREALESAAQWADEWLRRDQKAIASSHCGRYIRARAAEEGSDG
jgi:hypothetical protein